MSKLLQIKSALLAAMIGIVGCGAGGTEELMTTEVAKSQKQRVTNPDVSREDLATLVSGNTAFAMDLHQVLPKGENTFYSPYSISVALAMTYAGAKGNTEKEMAQGMHYELAQQQLHPAINALDLELASRGQNATGKDGGKFRLNITNAIWGQRDYGFETAYLDRIAESYGAGLRLMDFLEQPDQCRQTINKWVEDQTEQRIKELIPEGLIDSSTRLVLTNAIYFNAAWKEKFDPKSTRDGSFERLDGKQVTVPMMSQTEHLSYAKGSDWEAVELPYDGGELSMTFLLPAKGKFEQVEDSLTGQSIEAMVDGLQSTKVALTMPKFKMASKFKLKETLEQLGIEDAFAFPAADFTGIYTKRELYIGEVIHQSFIEVDEAGTEAAAATAVIMKAGAMPTEPVAVTLDRPFLFLIRDRQSGAVLFVGRVVDPTA